MLAVDLISMDDIENSHNFTDPQRREERLFEVLEHYMRSHFIDYEAYIYYYGVSKKLIDKTQQEK